MMEITSAKYTESGSIIAVIDGQTLAIPDDMSNRHRAAIAEWEKKGNKIAPYEPPPPFFAPLTARQLRLGLVLNDISISQIETAIAAIENQQDREVAQIEWEYASTFERQHPLIEQIGVALGLTKGEIDNMWEEASKL